MVIVYYYDIRQYGENAVPIPNSSTADKLSYLHKELQEKVINLTLHTLVYNMIQVILCNQTLIDILHRSGKVRRYDEITKETAPTSVMGRIHLKKIAPEQVR